MEEGGEGGGPEPPGPTLPQHDAIFISFPIHATLHPHDTTSLPTPAHTTPCPANSALTPDPVGSSSVWSSSRVSRLHTCTPPGWPPHVNDPLMRCDPLTARHTGYCPGPELGAGSERLTDKTRKERV